MPIKLLPSINGNPEWGDIAGNISAQSDLTSALVNKSENSHNHSLNDLNEKSYDSLDDLPDLSVFITKNELPDLIETYYLDGINAYLELSRDFSYTISGDFTLSIVFMPHDSDEFDIIACKGLRSSNTGWTLFLSYGAIGFSIGDGTKYLTLSHSKIIEDYNNYHIVVSYDNLEKLMYISINGEIEEFELSTLGDPANNIDKIQIGRNPATSSCTALSIHSFMFITDSINMNQIKYLERNICNSDYRAFKEFYPGIEVFLASVSSGKYYWYDLSGNERHAKVLGGAVSVCNSDQLVIPLNLLTTNLTLANAVPAKYEISYISILNHTSSPINLTFSSNSFVLIDSIQVDSGEEINRNINYLYSLYEDSDISLEFEETEFEVDIQIILKKVLPLIL